MLKLNRDILYVPARSQYGDCKENIGGKKGTHFKTRAIVKLIVKREGKKNTNHI